MEKVKLLDKTFKTFIPYGKISEAIDRVADKINTDFRGCEDIPVLLCVLNGSIMFTAELMKRLDFNCELVSIKLSSYQGTGSTGNVRQAMGLTADITGRRVIIVEDIVDTGNTIVELKRILKEHGAAESKVCTLLFKPDSYTKDIPLEYVAIEIPNDFIVGFGLDYNELGRNLKDIYVLDEDQQS
ncbi:MAG: hypoxanthine phosphoribosyltransferase [Bacteroidetes bacterium]|uniref:Hypoxanthine phosphoribosyltransferase n=1 Tax=Candidatus Cryptobacteroides intestinigallinarum TaxID=2840767 RepID=A0A9D9HKW7_9BACT|nr:hypoxanthine phosphoribosyltransferase [Candidatus Cryptobacteroides intestinigallinarum]